MTPTNQHLQEMGRASVAFQVALARIGAASIPEAIAIWRRLTPGRQAVTAARWLTEALAMIASRRERSRELALSYYRLARALRTGRTIPSIYDPKPTTVTLGRLREEFADLAGDGGYSPDGPGGDEEIPVDHDALSVDDIEQILADLDDEEDAQARGVLARRGPVRLELDENRLDPDELTGRDLDAARSESRRRAESAQAAGAARYVTNGGRNAVWAVSRDDPACLGFVRVGQGESCFFCQMLISRGPVYFNRTTALRQADGRKYHDNCDCISVPVFRGPDYRRADMFATNRELEALWKQRIHGRYSGRDAVYEWRRLVENRTGGRRLER